MSLTVADVDEADLLRRIFGILARSTPAQSGYVRLGPGDDSAVIEAPDKAVAVSTDILVEDQHFRTEWSTGYDVGWRAAMQNLADAVAMGAHPTAIVVAIVLPADTTVFWVEDFARGISEACARYGVAIAGGDLASGDAIVVCVTVLGDLKGATAITRTGAKAGHVVAVAGQVGWSAAGLAALIAGYGAIIDESATTIPAADQRRGVGSDMDEGAAISAVIGRFRRPQPALVEGLAARGRASAMMDVSDGLMRDAARLAKASDMVIDLVDVVAVLEEDVRVLERVAETLGIDGEQRAAQVREWLLTGGEDHGMLATFPRELVPDAFRVIGTVHAPDPHRGSPCGVYLKSEPYDGPAGWDHFRR